MYTSSAPRPGAWQSDLVRNVVAVLAVAALTWGWAPQAASAGTQPSAELVTNGSFSQGTSGWRTNSKKEVLEIVGGVAQLTRTERGSAVLNDAVNTVQNPAVGATYVVLTRVRSTTPSVVGALRVREVAGAAVRTSSSGFTLSDTSWHDVRLELTVSSAASHLDVNVAAWNLPVGRNLQIQYVSVKLMTATPTPTPQPIGGADKCSAPAPSGTVFGSMMSTKNQSAADAVKQIDTTFGRVPVIRHFDPGMPFAWDSTAAKLLKGRTIVTSFKVHPTTITSGQLDGFFRDWFKSAPDDQIIYWSYFHEPENNINSGEFTAAQYRAAWARLADLAKAACKPNLFATLILTEWTMDPGSKRDYRVYDAGVEYVKVLAFDPYNGIYDLDRTWYEPAADMLGPIVQKMDADGRPWGIAELGARVAPGDDGSKRATWLNDIGEYAKRHGALFVSYFNTEASDGDYRLQDAASIAAWTRLVQGG